MTARVPTWPRVEGERILCPVCGSDRVVSLAVIDYRGRGLEPDWTQTLLGPLRCEACQWRKGETTP